MNNTTFVIAEIGSCHDLDLDKAKHLIEVAKIAGADAAKFQFWSSAERMAHRRKAGAYLGIYRQYAMPEGWLTTLLDHCAKTRIEFMCSTYLPEDVEIIAPFVKRFKIASFEANDPQHLVAHYKYIGDRPVLISMGMGAQLRPVQQFLGRHLEVGSNAVKFLHCVSAYPAPLDQLNLRRLRWDWVRQENEQIAPKFDGFSDHAEADEVWTGAIAVAAGANIIERHLRSGETSHANPDYGHAMTPDDFMIYVKNIRFVETVLGLGGSAQIIGAVASEQPMRAYIVRD